MSLMSNGLSCEGYTIKKVRLWEYMCVVGSNPTREQLIFLWKKELSCFVVSLFIMCVCTCTVHCILYTCIYICTCMLRRTCACTVHTCTCMCVYVCVRVSSQHIPQYSLHMSCSRKPKIFCGKKRKQKDNEVPPTTHNTTH